MGPTKNNRLLDLTRLARRAGHRFTGVDRVERAYLEHLAKAGPLFGLVRSALGYVLLDDAGCRTFKDRLDRGDWGPPDGLSRLARLTDIRARVESDLRRLCLDRSTALGLRRMLERHLPNGIVYFNTGHSLKSDRVFRALRRIPGSKSAVMIHDTIPLDFPHYQRPDRIEPFAAFLQNAASHADVILCNSQQTEADVRRHAPFVKATQVALLGTDSPKPGEAPKGPWTGKPYFVVLGTVEPRKNHALLLDIWERHAPDADLLICGARGWENEGVFARLDRGIPRVHELPGLDDAAVFGLLKSSKALLFPSFAEGFGLPAAEAAALRVPLVLNDLPIYREFLGDIPVYADVRDSYLWVQTINGLLASEQTAPEFTPPTWEAHFKQVLTLF